MSIITYLLRCVRMLKATIFGSYMRIATIALNEQQRIANGGVCVNRNGLFVGFSRGGGPYVVPGHWGAKGRGRAVVLLQGHYREPGGVGPKHPHRS